MPKHTFKGLPGVVALALAAFAHAAEAPASTWDLAEREDGITVWEREIPNSDIRAVKAEMIMEAPAKRVWEVLNNREDYPEFMPYVEEVRLLERNEQAAIVYQRIDPPLISDRDYTIRVEADTDRREGRYQRCWRIANARGPDKREDIVRIRRSNGCWKLQRLSENRTRVRYRVHTDPGGSIPSWLVNQANSNSVPDLLRAVEKRARDPDWTQ